MRKGVLSNVLAVFVVTFAARGSAHGQSFFPIEIPTQPYLTTPPLAIVFDASPDGTRVGGTIILPGVEHDCASLRCTAPFTWSISEGISSNSLSGTVTLYETEYGPRWVNVEEIVSVTNGVSLGNGSMGYHNEPILFDDDGPGLLRVPNRGSPAMYATGISDDSATVVGTISDPISDRRPFYWTEQTGVQGIDTGAEQPTFATGVSGNGEVVIGISEGYNSNVVLPAFRWSAENGVQVIDAIPATGWNTPTAASYDGSVVVGTTGGWGNRAAYRWTEAQGTVAIELIDTFTASIATDVTADGRTLVGQLLVSTNGGLGWFNGAGDLTMFQWGDPTKTAEASHAMIWDVEHGTRLLRDVLVNQYGLLEELEGWALITAAAMSADGNVIAGVGVNPAGEFQGWVVVIPEPGALALAAIGFAVLATCRLRRSNSLTAR